MLRRAQTCIDLKESCKAIAVIVAHNQFRLFFIQFDLCAFSYSACLLPPPSSSFLQPLLQFLPLACLVHCLGPLCVRMLMTIIYLTGFTGCNYKEFMISALTCFHNLYSQLYGIYLYQVGICDSLHYF